MQLDLRRRALWLLSIPASVAFALACGGQTTGGDAGAEAGPDVITTGCGQFSTATFGIDASVCAPQLESTTSCNNAVCSWTVEVPCFGDAGAGDAGDAGDAGTFDCNAWCQAVAPPNSPATGFCQTFSQDGGMLARCGGCGV